MNLAQVIVNIIATKSVYKQYYMNILSKIVVFAIEIVVYNPLKSLRYQ